jgi:hypothetical protein
VSSVLSHWVLPYFAVASAPFETCLLERFTVIPVTEVVYALELVPVFDTRIPEIELSSATCLDAYHEYYVNSFADKETHHALTM